jgi:hypothetical protein
MNGRKLMVLLIAVLALVAAGCGGDSKSEATPATVETTVETDTVATDTNVAEDTTAADTTATDTTATSGMDTGALSGRCAEFAGISTKLAESLSGQTADLQQASKLFDEIADQVPDEIKADYQVIAENFKKIAEALKGVDLTSGQAPSPEALAKLQEISASMDSAEVQQATQHIEAWVQKNC